MSIIVLDPGHGGKDPGASGASGLREKDVVLSVASMMAQPLTKAGHKVILTRDHDVFVDLDARCRMANASGADVFLAIHTNAAANRSAHGTEFWTSPGQTRSDVLAEDLLAEWKGAPYAGMSVRSDMSDGDADKEARFRVLVGTKMPACLVEMEFISNSSGEAMLKDSLWRKARAAALAHGIMAFLARA